MQVGVGQYVIFPVASVANRSIYAASSDEVIAQGRATTYSFFMWSLYDVRQARTLGIASLINQAGNELRPSLNAVRNAINDFAATNYSGISFDSLVNLPGPRSWPLSTFSSAIIRQRTMRSCSDARALADFLRWTQYDATAALQASRQGYVLATVAAALEADYLTALKGFTCDGVTVSALANCISDDGSLCSSAGSCVNSRCECQSGRTGTYCEQFVDSSSVSDTTIAVVVGTTRTPHSATLCLRI